MTILLVGCSATGMASGAIAVASPSIASADPTLALEPTSTATVLEPTVEPPMALPPAAAIAVEGGDPVVGDLGSFNWQNGGSDSPWLPGSPIKVGAGEQLLLTLDQPVPVADWTVSRTPAASFGIGAIGMADSSGEPVTFSAPPPGSWSIHVSLTFAGGLGSAAYFWLVEVE